MAVDVHAGGIQHNFVYCDGLQGLLSVLLQRLKVTRCNQLSIGAESGEEGPAHQPEHGLHAARCCDKPWWAHVLEFTCSFCFERRTAYQIGGEMNTELVVALVAILPLCQGLPSLAQTFGIHSSSKMSSSSSEGSIVNKEEPLSSEQDAQIVRLCQRTQDQCLSNP